MSPTHYTITPKEIYRYAAGVLEPYLRWHDHGPKCTVTTLRQVLFYAAAQRCSRFAAGSRLRDAPSDQAVRDALAALCPPAETLEQPRNASFAAPLPSAVKKRRWRLASDLNLRPYYGQAHRRAGEPPPSQTRHDAFSCLRHRL
jgi:hypothetical protein